MITNDQCIEALGKPFEPSDWILLGEEGHELPCIAGNKGIVAKVIENDELAQACKEFLVNSGAKIFRTHQESWNIMRGMEQ